MKKSSFIDDVVFLTNAYYQKKQNKTKILYFQYLMHGKSVDEFIKVMNDKWDTINHSFMNKQIKKLQETINKDNIAEAINIGRMSKKHPVFKETGYWVVDNEYFKLTPESYFKEFEQKYKRGVIRNYEQALNDISKNKMDKQIILEDRLDNYDNQVNQMVTYFSKSVNPVTGRHDVVRHVNLSTYLSMIHNVNLTRGAWNQTISDANRLGKEMFIIPWHPFSCDMCLLYQNRPLSKVDVELVIGVEPIEQKGDILHPNCKCTLDIYWSPTQLQRIVWTPEEQADFYKIRQKVNSLTLEKSRLRADMISAKEIDDMKKYDKARQKISVINRNIREQKEMLPTDALRKQVVAIKR